MSAAFYKERVQPCNARMARKKYMQAPIAQNWWARHIGVARKQATRWRAPCIIKLHCAVQTICSSVWPRLCEERAHFSGEFSTVFPQFQSKTQSKDCGHALMLHIGHSRPDLRSYRLKRHHQMTSRQMIPTKRQCWNALAATAAHHTCSRQLAI
jgi:hypothetical protein